MSFFQKFWSILKMEFFVIRTVLPKLAQFPQFRSRIILSYLFFGGICWMFVACSNTYLIQGQKTGKFELGKAWPPVETFFWKGMTVNDTTFSEGGYEWGVQVLEDEEGKVFIEEDFFVKGKINRIRIEHPKWKSQQGIRIGQAFGEIKAQIGRGSVTFIPTYKVLDVVSDKLPSIHYLLKTQDPDKWANAERINMDDIPAELLIYSIVIL